LTSVSSQTNTSEKSRQGKNMNQLRMVRRLRLAIPPKKNQCLSIPKNVFIFPARMLAMCKIMKRKTEPFMMYKTPVKNEIMYETY
jgi:hypothetical protein